MNDVELKQWHEQFQVGDRVRHYGTRAWGVVRSIKPTSYGVELLVAVDLPSSLSLDFPGAPPRWWEGSKIDGHIRDGKRLVW